MPVLTKQIHPAILCLHQTVALLLMSFYVPLCIIMLTVWNKLHYTHYSCLWFQVAFHLYRSRAYQIWLSVYIVFVEYHAANDSNCIDYWSITRYLYLITLIWFHYFLWTIHSLILSAHEDGVTTCNVVRGYYRYYRYINWNNSVWYN